jgi:hypothetical protein
MPDPQIPNPAGLYGFAGVPNVQHVEVVNNSGGTLLPGDVVAFTTDVTGCLVTTTTTLNDKTVLGVVAARVPTDSINTQSATGPGLPYSAGAVIPVIVRGPARINVGANTPAAADILTTSTVAKAAITNAGAPAANAVIGSLIAICIAAAKDANNTVVAYINKF